MESQATHTEVKMVLQELRVSVEHPTRDAMVTQVKATQDVKVKVITLSTNSTCP